MNYSILAKDNVQIQGINIEIKAEYKQGELPNKISVNGSGQIEQTQNYMSVSAYYNLAENRFETCNGTNLPAGFIGEVETAIQETFAAIRQNGGEA